MVGKKLYKSDVTIGGYLRNIPRHILYSNYYPQCTLVMVRYNGIRVVRRVHGRSREVEASINSSLYDDLQYEGILPVGRELVNYNIIFYRSVSRDFVS